jgi:hypothetical protein
MDGNVAVAGDIQPAETRASSDRKTEPTKGSKADSLQVEEVELDATVCLEDFRASRFAEKDEFSWWFPKIKGDEETSRIWKSRRSRALMLQIFLIGTILIANLALTVYAVGQYGSQDGVGVIYEGDCTTVGNLDQWLHLLINLLGTCMLSASNYFMQLQAAPTRADVDRAHQRNKWLDIGVPSLRNLGYIGS